MKKRLLCLLLSLAMLLPMLLQAVPTAQAVTKQTVTRAISIAFDNSGSMYSDDRDQPLDRWCQAIYAMEVFAAMMNEGDTLQIYPMWPITEGKDGKEIQLPLVINGPSESEKIRNIYTPAPSMTPFSAIINAYEGLMRTNADEKYLIVLTDGAYTSDVPDKGAFETMVDYSNDVNVMYLGISSAAPVPSAAQQQHITYGDATKSENVLPALASMCNQIFGRKMLEGSNISGNQINFDVSMSKLIVFVQGQNISNLRLSGGTLVSEKSMKYSEAGGSGWYGGAVDENLQGMLVTYEGLDAGTYDLSFSGTQSSISVYYEPDVDLQVRFVGEGGTIDPSAQELYAGTYKLTFEMVDKDGNPTSSALLGTVDYEVTYTIDGQEYTQTASGSGSVDVELKAGAKLDAGFKVRYLDDYTIYKDSAALGWPIGGIQIGTRPAGDTRLEVEGGSRRYDLSTLEEEAVYHVSVIYEGQKLTGDALAPVTFPAPQLEGGNAKVDVQKVEDGWTVSLKYNGDASATQTGEQALVFQASYTNEDGQTANAEPIRQEFEIEDDSMSLKLKLLMERDYYVLTDLENGKPMVIKLTAGGESLTAEQFAAAKVTVKIGGKTVETQPDAAGSRHTVAASVLAGMEAGTHEVVATVEGVDSLGHPTTAEDTGKLELQSYPEWMRWLFWLLVIAIVVFAICAYLNAKRLPKSAVVLEGLVFTVDGETVSGDVSPKKPGFGTKKGSLTIESPDYMLNPMAACGFTLDLVANTPRRVKSASRNARVVGIRPMDPVNTVMVMIGGTQFLMDQEKGQLFEAGTSGESPIDFSIGGTTNFVVMSEVQSMHDSGTVTCTLSGEFEFR